MIIYTDGATSNNGKANAIGGWAFIIINDNGEIIKKESGRIETNATNNICELMALIKACEAVKDMPYIFTVYSDSAYCINCYKFYWYRKWQQNGWVNSNKKPVANKELWELLIPYFLDERFTFEKVQGHADNRYNNIVDQMAVAARS